jgi:hypothetical protein
MAMKKMAAVFLVIILVVLVILVIYFFVGKAPEQKNITWGINFSQMQAEVLKLDWKKTYLAILEDLGAKKIKLITDWDWVEGKRGDFYFNDIDWQISQAESHRAQIVYVIGMKTGRWPECHVPIWANSISKQEQQNELLTYIKEVVTRYKESPAIVAWQAENEPLFNFGQCPWYDKNFLAKEVALIKSLDPSRPVMVSDSGEQSMWLGAGRIGDIVGTTMYRKLWFHVADGFGFYGTFPLPPVFYWRRAQLIKYLFGKSVICVELQAEPWAYKQFYNVSLQEQEKSMDLAQFTSNVSYAKQTGLNEFYFWGAEWWYWLKEKQNKPEIWNEAKQLLQS